MARAVGSNSAVCLPSHQRSPSWRWLCSWHFLERRVGEEGSFWKTFLPCMIPLGVLAGLVVKEPDLGTALMLAIIGMTICFAAGVRPRHVVYAAVPGLLYVAKMVIFTPFRWRRMATL